MKRISVVFGVVLSLSLPVNGFAQNGWEQREDGWYYIQENGSAASGWIEEGGKSYYMYGDGKRAMDCVTPDGYYVDGEGAWYIRSTSLLEDIVVTAPERFVSSWAGQEGWFEEEKLEALKTAVVKAFGGSRTIVVSDSAIEYRVAKSKQVLIGLYKERDKQCYRLDLGISLNQGSVDDKQEETYDYAVFKALLYQFSSSPDILEQAIYSGWQGSNQWGINRDSRVEAGDSRILYSTVTGFGRFWIDARAGE